MSDITSELSRVVMSTGRIVRSHGSRILLSADAAFLAVPHDDGESLRVVVADGQVRRVSKTV